MRRRGDVTTRLVLLSVVPVLVFTLVLWWTTCTLVARVFVGQYLEQRSREITWILRHGADSTLKVGDLNPVARWVLVQQQLPPIAVTVVESRSTVELELPASWHKRLVFLLRGITALYAAVAFTAILILFLLVRVGVARPLEALARRVRAYTELAPDDVVGHAMVRLPELDRTDEIGELARSFRDVTQSLAQEKYKVQRSEQFASYGEFAGGLAHELGNPLAVALQEVYAAQHGSTDGSFRLDAESGPAVREALRRVDGIVRGLQALYRGGAIESHVLGVDEVVRAVQARFVQHVLDTQCEGNLQVYAHRYLLEQALYNLVRNAHQAQIKGGVSSPVTLTVERDADAVVFRIRDQGGGVRLGDDGLPMQDLTKQGMGLGLSLVARSVELMRGAMRFANYTDSAGHVGTQVVLRLPANFTGDK